MRKTTKLATALVVLAVAATPFSDALRYDAQRNHLAKQQFTRSAAAPSERLVDIACENGMADVFPCDNVDLVAFIPDDEMLTANTDPVLTGGGLSDIWGWTSPDTGDEYAFFGKTNGTAFYRITDADDPTAEPAYLGELPNPGPAELVWHDMKVNDGYAYIVSETPGHGVQVVDLSVLDLLPASPSPVSVIPQVAHYTIDGTAHNIVIDDENDRAYLVGSGQVLGMGGVCTVDGNPLDNAGLHALDISDPLVPVYLGCHAAEGYVHDAECATYHGPDTRYTDHQICVTAHEDGVAIVDVTDFPDTVTLSDTQDLDYPGVAYSHQGWLSEDQAFYFHGDELDEKGRTATRTLIFDIRDLTDIKLYDAYEHLAVAGDKNAKDVHKDGVKYRVNIDHNMYTHDGLLYQSDYEAGLRVFDYSGIGYDAEGEKTGTLQEVAHFDTYPDSNLAEFNGTWSNYPYFPSGKIVVTGIGEGLFVLKLHDGIAPWAPDTTG